MVEVGGFADFCCGSRSGRRTAAHRVRVCRSCRGSGGEAGKPHRTHVRSRSEGPRRRGRTLRPTVLPGEHPAARSGPGWRAVQLAVRRPRCRGRRPSRCLRHDLTSSRSSGRRIANPWSPVPRVRVRRNRQRPPSNSSQRCRCRLPASGCCRRPRVASPRTPTAMAAGSTPEHCHSTPSGMTGDPTPDPCSPRSVATGASPRSPGWGLDGIVKIRFYIELDGTITGLRIIDESGKPPMDFAARDAIADSSTSNRSPPASV